MNKKTLPTDKSDDPVGFTLVKAKIIETLAEIETHFLRSARKKGINTAKKKGAYVGRKKGTYRVDPELIKKLRSEGYKVNEIAKKEKISRRTVQRYLNL
jgi:DNA invertase Pin-like site-specific DNA recombinase